MPTTVVCGWFSIRVGFNHTGNFFDEACHLSIGSSTSRGFWSAAVQKYKYRNWRFTDKYLIEYLMVVTNSVHWKWSSLPSLSSLEKMQTTWCSTFWAPSKEWVLARTWFCVAFCGSKPLDRFIQWFLDGAGSNIYHHRRHVYVSPDTVYSIVAHVMDRMEWNAFDSSIYIGSNRHKYQLDGSVFALLCSSRYILRF